MKYIKIIDNKRACIGNGEECLDNICAVIHAKIKNNMLNEANIELLNIKKHVCKYINDMRDHHAKSANKKITNDNSTNKKVDKSTNKKIIIDKITNKEITINKITRNNKTNIPISTVRKRKGVNACDNINNTNTCTQENKLEKDLKRYTVNITFSTSK